MSHLKNLAKQTAIYGLTGILFRFIGFAFTPWFTRILNTEDFGIYIELYAYIAVLQVLLTYGMETAYFRFVNKYEENKKVYSTILSSLISTSLLFVTLTIVFKDQLNLIFNYKHPSIFIWFALINAFDAISVVPLARLRTEGKALRYGIIRIGEVLFLVAATLFFYVFCKNQYLEGSNNFFAGLYRKEFLVEYAFIANAFASLFKLLLMSDLIFGKINFEKKIWKDMLLYSFPLMLSQLPGVLNDLLDRISLRYLLPDNVNALQQLGIYGAAVKIAAVIAIYTTFFRLGAEPFFFNISKEKDSKSIYSVVMTYFSAIGLILLVAIVCYMDVFQLLIGKDFRESISVVPILLLSYMFFGMQYNLSIWYKLSDLTKYAIRITLLGISVNIILNILFVPYYGYTAAAWSKLASFTAMIVYSYIMGQKHYPVDYKIKKIILYIFIAVLIIIIVPFINVDNFILSLTIKTLLFALYTAMIYKFENIGQLIKKYYDSKGKK